MKTILPIIVALVLCQLTLGGSTNSPMTRIVTRYLSPENQPGSFRSKPKTVYIASDRYSRSEEEPDPENGIHGLIVVSEPDLWMINLFDHTGRHIVDPGPTYIVHHNILEREAPPEFETLEFGKEVAFFRKHKANSLPAREIDQALCDASEFTQKPYRVVLYTKAKTDVPWQLEVYKNGKLDFGIRYLNYETNRPFDPSLFRPPPGIAMTEEPRK